MKRIAYLVSTATLALTVAGGALANNGVGSQMPCACEKKSVAQPSKSKTGKTAPPPRIAPVNAPSLIDLIDVTSLLRTYRLF